MSGSWKISEKSVAFNLVLTNFTLHTEWPIPIYCWFYSYIVWCCLLSVPVLYNVLLNPGSVLVSGSAVMCSHQTSLISLHHTSPLSSWQEKNSCLLQYFLIYLKSQCFCFVTYFYTHVLRFIIKDFNLCYFCCVSLLIKKNWCFADTLKIGYCQNIRIVTDSVLKTVMSVVHTKK